VRTVVIAGASLAGLAAARALRAGGFDGTIRVVGDESHLPYDRPPLSKQVLAGTWDPAKIALLRDADEGLEVDWVLGRRAEALDTAARTVTLDGGAILDFDGLVVATGATPRRLPTIGDVGGVHVLRTLDDCLGLKADLDAGSPRVAVIGAGFIGAEVAATARQRGLDVTLVEVLPVPLERALGGSVGMVFAELHRDHGVDVRLGVGVDGIDGTERVERLRLADGSAIDADVVVVGVGVTPNIGWLAGSGLTLEDGVLCNETLLAAPGVVAAGDIARWPNRRFGDVMRVEHWDNAVAMGAHAGRRLLAGDGDADPYEPIPYFWSDQYDRKLQLVGRSAGADHFEIVTGSLEERQFVGLYGRGGQVLGALGMNRPRHVMQANRFITDGVPFDTACSELAAV
jgi:3-phenylpropionate/trans-cinnamate dioxygenase ferredoxin reductase subunit